MTPSRFAVIFDMDGTLTRDGHDYDRIRAEIGLGREPILEAVARMDDEQRGRAEAILHRHEAEAATNSELRPNAGRVVRELRAARIPVALMTRNSRRSVETLLTRHHLTFDIVRTREDGPFKPSPMPVVDICVKLGVQPDESWVVGDYRYDIECGRAAGATTVLVLEGNVRPDWAGEADFVIHDLLELLGCMKGRGLTVSPSAC